MIGRFKHHYRLLFRLILTGYVLLLLVASVIPVPQTGAVVFSSMDKLIHGLLYGFLAVFIFLVVHSKPLAYSPFKAFLFAFFLSSVYGALLEALQFLLPHRFYELWDIVANTLGALLFAMMAFLYSYYFKPSLSD